MNAMFVRSDTIALPLSPPSLLLTPTSLYRPHQRRLNYVFIYRTGLSCLVIMSPTSLSHRCDATDEC
ncbi:hypothetical protein E2C01_091889 [Portunus trituberculatus]|uniref:Uncharacterized protein n=1 Tax=Portunus trituberculatus TaxID=210409 RepID=A0A5B7JIS1_PORTR|nr:hypothetical protein [Portunus trituberculatus]